jgi:anti-sigma factor RsiW
MPCPDFEERLLEYDELTAGGQDAVDAHLAGCGDCRAFFSVLHDMDTALTAAFADRHVSPVFADRVSQKLRAQAPPRRPSMIPEVLDATGWAGVVAIVLWLATFFVPGLDFSIPVALTIGTMLLIAGFWVAYRCYGDLRRS